MHTEPLPEPERVELRERRAQIGPRGVQTFGQRPQLRIARREQAAEAGAQDLTLAPFSPAATSAAVRSAGFTTLLS